MRRTFAWILTILGAGGLVYFAFISLYVIPQTGGPSGIGGFDMGGLMQFVLYFPLGLSALFLIIGVLLFREEKHVPTPWDIPV